VIIACGKDLNPIPAMIRMPAVPDFFGRGVLTLICLTFNRPEQYVRVSI